MTKKFVYSLILMLITCVGMGFSQTLHSYEYWLDDDYTNKKIVTNTSSDISFSADLSGLNAGLHILNFRAKNTQGQYSAPYRYLVYIASNSFADASLSSYEYWLDDDYTNKKIVTNTKGDISFSADLSGLTAGIHFLNFRAKNSQGQYSAPYRYLVYIASNSFADASLSSYEYWLDDDYTNKKIATNTSSDISFSADLSGLTAGVHFLNFRAKNSQGQYSAPYRYLVYIASNSFADATLSSYEYWIDDDYANKVTVASREQLVSFTADVSKYAEGVHFLNFRAKNSLGEYGTVQRNVFYLNGETSSGNTTIAGYRYSFNGVGNYVAVNATESYSLNAIDFDMPNILDVASINSASQFIINSSEDEVSLSRTTDVCFTIQFKNSGNKWSVPETTSYQETDELSHKAVELGIQKSIKVSKVKKGDYHVLKMVIPEFKSYYIKASQACQMELFTSVGNKVVSVKPEEMLNTYGAGLSAGIYYGIIYNTVVDGDNNDSDITLKLMLTNNYVPEPEIKYNNETVTITCAQEGADIYYTLDGTVPSKSSTRYVAPFKLTHNATIKAVAVYSDMADSNIASYTINSYKVAAPTIEYANLKVYIATTTPNAKIYYSTDGSDPSTNGILYTKPTEVNQNCTIKAVGKLDGYNNSDITSKYIDVDNVTCATPTFTLSGQSLTISTLTEGATIYYTMDGSTPTTSSQKYNSAITLSHNCIVKAIAVKSGQITSPVASYNVNVFQAAKPTFSFANNTLTITCQTPGSIIYYTIGTGVPSTSSDVYTQPIVLSDNRPVSAIAVAEGFNDSEIATYTPASFACEDVHVLYDGRTISMTAQDGVTIHYTKDGSEPTTASSVYSGPILLDGLYTIKAIAVKEYKNNSNVTTYETPCFYNGGMLRMAKPGNLYKAFEWCGIDAIDHVTIYGEVNETDLKFISTMPALDRISLGVASVTGNILSDGAFTNSMFRSIVLPSSLTKCGKNIFSGNKRLCAVKWNADIAVPVDMFGGINNPNLLLYVNSKSYAPSSIQNVVVNYNAESIILHDGYDFYACDAFKANRISYTHKYTMETVKGVSRGWESISLPFNVTKYTHAVNGNIAPFAKNVANAKPFWLYELDERTGFVKASDIEAYKPYIISMPNNSDYAEEYILGGEVTFVGENVQVPETNITTVNYGHFTFTPCFENLDKAASIYALNTYQEYNGYPEGSLFASELRNVKPFEAYMKSNSMQAKAYMMIFDDDNVDGIEDVVLSGHSLRVWSENHKLLIYSNNRQTIRIYSSSGQLIKVVDITEGHNTVTGISDGIYIVNGIKVFVK